MSWPAPGTASRACAWARGPDGRVTKYKTAHHVDYERRFPAAWRSGLPSLGFSHYRFGGHSYELLRRKRQGYERQRNARAHIYDVILSYVHRPAAGPPELNARFRAKVECGAACPG